MILSAIAEIACDGTGCSAVFTVKLPIHDDFTHAADSARARAAQAGWAYFRWFATERLGDYCPDCLARRQEGHRD